MVTLGEQTIGTSVYLNVNGVRTEFIVIHHGRPTEYYGSVCAEGTWLLMKHIYTLMAWDATNLDYANSDVHAYLNGEFINLLDEDVLTNAVLQVKVPYRKGATGTTTGNKENGIAVKAFLLSNNEVGFGSASNIIGLGTKLSWFATLTSDAQRATTALDGTHRSWWTRSVNTSSGSNYVRSVNSSSGIAVSSNRTSTTGGVRPCMVLSSATELDINNNVYIPKSALDGYVSINGVNKKLLRGYANINGSWKKLIRVYMNINGIWKPEDEKVPDTLVHTWKKYSVKTAYTQQSQTAVNDTVMTASTAQNGAYYTRYATSLSLGSDGYFTARNYATVSDVYNNPSSYAGCYFAIDSRSGTIASRTSTSARDSQYLLRMPSGTTYDANGNLKGDVTRYWATSTTTKGDYVGDVSSTNTSAYPDNGIQDGYWYVKQ